MVFKKGEISNPRGGPKKYDIPSDWSKKYSMAKAQAKYRREEWAFDEHSWYKLWLDSGVTEHMGKHVQCYCMTRKDKIEAWGPHNCIIIPRRKHFRKMAYVGFHNFPNADWRPQDGVTNAKESE